MGRLGNIIQLGFKEMRSLWYDKVLLIFLVWVFSFGIYDAVRLTVRERTCLTEVAEVPDDCPVIIGQTPLEVLDFVVDPKGQKLIGNPDHGGEQMIDLF